MAHTDAHIFNFDLISDTVNPAIDPIVKTAIDALVKQGQPIKHSVIVASPILYDVVILEVGNYIIPIITNCDGGRPVENITTDNLHLLPAKSVEGAQEVLVVRFPGKDVLRPTYTNLENLALAITTGYNNLYPYIKGDTAFIRVGNDIMTSSTVASNMLVNKLATYTEKQVINNRVPRIQGEFLMNQVISNDGLVRQMVLQRRDTVSFNEIVLLMMSIDPDPDKVYESSLDEKILYPFSTRTESEIDDGRIYEGVGLAIDIHINQSSFVTDRMILSTLNGDGDSRAALLEDLNTAFGFPVDYEYDIFMNESRDTQMEELLYGSISLKGEDMKIEHISLGNALAMAPSEEAIELFLEGTVDGKVEWLHRLNPNTGVDGVVVRVQLHPDFIDDVREYVEEDYYIEERNDRNVRGRNKRGYYKAINSIIVKNNRGRGRRNSGGGGRKRTY